MNKRRKLLAAQNISGFIQKEMRNAARAPMIQLLRLHDMKSSFTISIIIASIQRKSDRRPPLRDGNNEENGAGLSSKSPPALSDFLDRPESNIRKRHARIDFGEKEYYSTIGFDFPKKTAILLEKGLCLTGSILAVPTNAADDGKE